MSMLREIEAAIADAIQLLCEAADDANTIGHSSWVALDEAIKEARNAQAEVNASIRSE